MDLSNWLHVFRALCQTNQAEVWSLLIGLKSSIGFKDSMRWVCSALAMFLFQFLQKWNLLEFNQTVLWNYEFLKCLPLQDRFFDPSKLFDKLQKIPCLVYNPLSCVFAQISAYHWRPILWSVKGAIENKTNPSKFYHCKHIEKKIRKGRTISGRHILNPHVVKIIHCCTREI